MGGRAYAPPHLPASPPACPLPALPSRVRSGPGGAGRGRCGPRRRPRGGEPAARTTSPMMPRARRLPGAPEAAPAAVRRREAAGLGRAAPAEEAEAEAEAAAGCLHFLSPPLGERSPPPARSPPAPLCAPAGRDVSGAAACCPSRAPTGPAPPRRSPTSRAPTPPTGPASRRRRTVSPVRPRGPLSARPQPRQRARTAFFLPRGGGLGVRGGWKGEKTHKNAPLLLGCLPPHSRGASGGSCFLPSSLPAPRLPHWRSPGCRGTLARGTAGPRGSDSCQAASPAAPASPASPASRAPSPAGGFRGDAWVRRDVAPVPASPGARRGHGTTRHGAAGVFPSSPLPAPPRGVCSPPSFLLISGICWGGGVCGKSRRPNSALRRPEPSWV